MTRVSSREREGEGEGPRLKLVFGTLARVTLLALVVGEKSGGGFRRPNL